MVKFKFAKIKERVNARLNVKKYLYNTVAPHMIQLEQSVYQGAIDNLQNCVAKKQLTKKTISFLEEFYDKSLINNKTFKKGLAPDGMPWENYVGDKKLYNKVVNYLPVLLEHKSFLNDDDCGFIELTLIPFLKVLKSETLNTRIKTWNEIEGD